MKKLTESDLQKLLQIMNERQVSADRAIELISRYEPKPEDKIIFTVDYNKSPWEMIRDGNYNEENYRVYEIASPSHSKLSGHKVTLSGRLFSFNQDISINDIVAEMYKLEYRPATTPELLALGASYPDLQRDFKILALGSLVLTPGSDSSKSMPCLLFYHGRELRGHFRKSSEKPINWDKDFRFLAVRTEKDEKIISTEIIRDDIDLYVDYRKNLTRVIRRGGYNEISESISGDNYPYHFTRPEKVFHVGAKIFKFTGGETSEEIISKMDEFACRPATLAELLALRDQHYKELSGEFEIVALGSIRKEGDNEKFVVSLVGELVGNHHKRRQLSLLENNFSSPWKRWHTFLAIRK